MFLKEVHLTVFVSSTLDFSIHKSSFFIMLELQIGNIQLALTFKNCTCQMQNYENLIQKRRNAANSFGAFCNC